MVEINVDADNAVVRDCLILREIRAHRRTTYSCESERVTVTERGNNMQKSAELLPTGRKPSEETAFKITKRRRREKGKKREKREAAKYKECLE